METNTGSRVKKHCDLAQTVPEEKKDKLWQQYQELHPKALLAEIHRLQERDWMTS